MKYTRGSAPARLKSYVIIQKLFYIDIVLIHIDLRICKWVWNLQNE